MSTSYIWEGKAGMAHPIADDRVGMQVKLRIDPLRTRAIPERFCGGVSRRGAMSSVRTFTFTLTNLCGHGADTLPAPLRQRL